MELIEPESNCVMFKYPSKALGLSRAKFNFFCTYAEKDAKLEC